MARAYLDHASTSPLRPGVLDAMLPWLRDAADPGRVHTEGRMARAALESAREQVASLLGCRSSREVVFTSGATESINAAVFGATRGERDAIVVATAVEHSAVRAASSRHRLIETPVGHDGAIDAEALVDEAARAGAALVHCQWGNHEVGTLQPVLSVAARCRERGILVHVDAAQAAGRVDVDFSGLDADLMSVSAHKLGGPPGIGALLVRRGLRIEPYVVGGEQERARRAGMEDVAAAVGFGHAAAMLGGGALAAEEAQARGQTDALAAGLSRVTGVRRFGSLTDRLPHIVCVGVDGVEAEPVLVGLDQAGFAVHSGSSCSSESLEPSPVLQAMGVDAERSLRVSVGWSTSQPEVEGFVEAFPDVVRRLRGLASGH